MKNCLQCKKSFKKPYKETRNEFTLRKYCSKSCSNKANTGKGGFKKGHPQFNHWKGKKHTEASKIKMGLAGKGRVPPNKGKKSLVPAWNKGIKKATNTGRTHFKKGEGCGDKHWNWQGGITPINQHLRDVPEYKEWRSGVYTRDHFTCICGRVGGKLVAHHIQPFAKFPELRYIISNGITLCENCHKLIHKKK